MPDQTDQIEASLLHQEAEMLAEFRPLSNATTQTAQVFRTFEDTARKMKVTAADAAARIEALRRDDVMNPEGRDRLIVETEDAARTMLRRMENRLYGAIEVMGKGLEAAALPKVNPAREAFARDEARMYLDGSADPVRTMSQLATRGDDVAAVLLGSYGESYLRARRFSPKDAKDAALVVKTVAVGAARQSADVTAASAAAAYFKLDRVRGLAAVTRSNAWTPLERIGVER